MTAAFNIAPHGFTPQNHPHRGLRPDRETIERMLSIAGDVQANLARVFPQLDLTTAHANKGTAGK